MFESDQMHDIYLNESYMYLWHRTKCLAWVCFHLECTFNTINVSYEDLVKVFLRIELFDTDANDKITL